MGLLDMNSLLCLSGDHTCVHCTTYNLSNDNDDKAQGMGDGPAERTSVVRMYMDGVAVLYFIRIR